MTGDLGMYAGAIAVIVAVGCVVELVEGRAERRRSEKKTPNMTTFLVLETEAARLARLE
tara:strand:+ start:573 stop:749 length:177 start_codon:yes stop_codon:yes gene_type:complete